MINDIILTGPPRSGTTLTCFLLNKVENTVALHEPMRLPMFSDHAAGIASVRSFFPEMRNSLMKDGVAISKVKDGMIPANPFGNKSTDGRKSIVRKGPVRFDKPLSPDFKLVIKHNGHFTFLLPELQDHFPIYVILRNPVSTIASWNSIPAPVSKGNLKVLETLNPVLFKSLNDIPDLVARQVRLLDEMYLAYRKSSKAVFIKYEDIISSGGSVLKAIVPEANALSEPLQSKNTNPLYDAGLINDIKKELLDQKGCYLDFYSSETIEKY